ncbi:RNA-binding domain-containing protein [Schizosaccharomyces pombe]|uniref:U1 small nuclear ribonucleoprotein 70 kDa homolog n=1 Tax=Schizosaccharomyces pombe (strain 972 / ATCC 24843) TaxID=284812 RepID=RU17_SCHPO|nr:putative U1 snRNP-associated protein Usp101 [Schizosaccharomyces pombe]O13829.1 RecName: Full=U1 small nuclear ribonucleoprotein 70 kDa homolog; Short=U1 70K; Short=U1 snRNP 70 kDa homolog; Short=U1-70K; AltName: Full=U1 small nuclear ribonucleoprotein usp101; Short=U1 snRNP protein usp101 [Schizosaccharomyces pombe 972h-]CAB11649.1 U1 snRNP-associated protein Usp101 (predicted) [Schizosaccharomyces pombe]|eukprot:NP_593779.1 putative U1 snRNP-associated protein Usp101 [Schizosaccharomyces pombe]
MAEKLPAPLLALFAPRPPLRYLPPMDVPPEKRSTPRVSGIAKYLKYAQSHDQQYHPTESLEEKRLRLRDEKQKQQRERLRSMIKVWDPDHDRHVIGDPYKTMFLSRLSYDTKESDIEREFTRYGPIERIRVVRNKVTGKSMGYAFVVFERERDLKVAYKASAGLMLNGRRIVVDVERGRTVKGWLPRKLGGGLGGRHYTKERPRRERGSRFRGDSGFRGGYRGGFRKSSGGGSRFGRGPTRSSHSSDYGGRDSSPKRRRYN